MIKFPSSSESNEISSIKSLVMLPLLSSKILTDVSTKMSSSSLSEKVKSRGSNTSLLGLKQNFLPDSGLDGVERSC